MAILIPQRQQQPNNPHQKQMQQHFQKIISAFTLNYSGILDSPYEFYSNQFEKEQRELSRICRALITKLPHYDAKTFKWEIGKIDQLYHRERYTPIYDPDVGVENGRLINQEVFEQRWEERFQQVPAQQFTKQQRNNMKLFDFLQYSTIVAYSNNIQDLENIRFQQCSVEKYCAVQAKFFQKSFVNEQRKISKTIKTLSKRQLDIIFLQQTNEHFRKAIQQCGRYTLVWKKGVQSAILVKKDSFHNVSLQTQLDFETPNWNEDTIWCKLGKLVLVSAHLTSKTEKNQQQVATVIRDIKQFKKNHPQMHILIGIDANSFINLRGQPDFHIFPMKEEVATTNKERTWMQPQVKKADTVARSCKDHILSDLTLNTCEVSIITGSNLNILIPTEMHPYDHYLVSTQVHTQL